MSIVKFFDLKIKPLSWIQVLLLAPIWKKEYLENQKWDFFSNGRYSDDVTEFPIYFGVIWHTFPIIAQSAKAYQIIYPTEFKLKQHRIHAYWFTQGVNYTWITKNPAFAKLETHPYPCSSCGWYCQQSCNL